jgi:hypothetical protein
MIETEKKADRSDECTDGSPTDSGTRKVDGARR